MVNFVEIIPTELSLLEVYFIGDIIKLKDEKLPEGWEKKAKFKTSASKAGKWDVVIIG